MLFFHVPDTFPNVTVVEALGGESICNSGYTVLGDIDIYENLADDFNPSQTNKTLILTVPAGYELKPSMGSVLYLPGFNIISASILVTSTTVTITISTDGSADATGDKLRISGLEVKATSASPLALSGNLMRLSSNAGTFIINGITNDASNFATLAQANVMQYQASDVFQSSTANLELGEENAHLLQIKINVTGMCDAIVPSELTFNTAGSTNPAIDIAQAKLFYTGNSSLFNTVFQVGFFSNPSGTFVIPVDAMTLIEGENYFWLTYDINPLAIFGNTADAECTSIKLGVINHVPSTKAPAGARTIGMTTIFSNATGGGMWSDPNTWLGGIVPTESNHLEIKAGDMVILDAQAAIADILIKDGAQLLIGSYRIDFYGVLSIEGTADVLTNCESEVNIYDRGNSKQFEFAPGMVEMMKIGLNRANGALSNHDIDLSNCVPADSIVLVLDNGPLVLFADYRLYLHSSDILRDIPSSNDSYVDGFVSRKIPDDGIFSTFPVGDEGMSRKYGVAVNNQGFGINEVRFNHSTPPNMCCINLANLPGGVNDKYYWEHLYDAAGGNPQRRIYYENGDFPHMQSWQRISSLTLADNAGTSSVSEWDTPNSPREVYDSPSEKYVQFQNSNNGNNSVYWTFGSLEENNPVYESTLPVELILFKVFLHNNEVGIEWATASENNSDYFTVQKSKDGIDFVSIGNVSAAGFSTTRRNYSFTDPNPYSGISYYRLVKTDIDGSTDLSEPQAINLIAEVGKFRIFPNPVKRNAIINIDLEQFTQTDVTVSIYGMMGRRFYHKEVKANSSVTLLKIPLNKEMAKGMYVISITNAQNQFREKFMVN